MPARPSASRFYFLVVQGGSSSIFHLPPTGVVLLGRDPNADLPILDQTASRSHAKVMTADGSARIVDLDSHNGTSVNGERIEGTRALASGDVVTIGELTLVLHAHRRAPAAHEILDAGALRQRVTEEVERATHYQRPLALMLVSLPSAARRDEVSAALAARLRLIDLIGIAGAAQLVVVMPEVGSDARAEAEALATAAPEAAIGLACCPDDACDADTLLATARAAAAAAAPGSVALAADAARQIALGDRSVVVADPAMVRLFELIARLAASDLPILVLGETGAGKEGAALARAPRLDARQRPVRHASTAPRFPRTWSRASCSATKRAPSPAPSTAKPGLLETAHGGTLFLDEIGELPLAVQAKLLRVLEQKRLTRVGRRQGARGRRARRRRHQPLRSRRRCTPGRFRQDLFFRLGAATVVLPPLRDRPREIPILARRFLGQACARASREPPTISTAAMQTLAAYALAGQRARAAQRHGVRRGDGRGGHDRAVAPARQGRGGGSRAARQPDDALASPATAAVPSRRRGAARARAHAHGAGARSVRRRAAPRRRAHRHAAAHLRHEAQAVRHLAARATRSMSRAADDWSPPSEIEEYRLLDAARPRRRWVRCFWRTTRCSIARSR